MMDRERRGKTERILDLTLEIIHLLTGEECEVVKKTSGERLTPNIRPHETAAAAAVTAFPPHSMTPERQMKVLGATKKMMELLTGEIGILSDLNIVVKEEDNDEIDEDMTKERTCPGGDRDLYKDVVMENEPPLTSPDGSRKRNPPERCPRPLYSRDPTQEGLTIPHHDQSGKFGACNIIIKEENKEEEEEDGVKKEVSDGHQDLYKEPPERCPRPLSSRDPTQEDLTVPHESECDNDVKDEIKEEEEVGVTEELPEDFKDPIKDVMMEPLSDTNPPERCPHPLYSQDPTQEDLTLPHHDQCGDPSVGEVDIKKEILEEDDEDGAMEESEFPKEHKDLDQDIVMEPLSKKNPPERSPRPLDSRDPTQEDLTIPHHDQVFTLNPKVEVREEEEKTNGNGDQLSMEEGGPLCSRNTALDDHNYAQHGQGEKEKYVRDPHKSAEEEVMILEKATSSRHIIRAVQKWNIKPSVGRFILSPAYQAEDCDIAQHSPKVNSSHSERSMDPSNPEEPSDPSHHMTSDVHQGPHSAERSMDPSNPEEPSVSHEGERPYTCSKCGKSLKSKKTLRKHRKIHRDVQKWYIKKSEELFILCQAGKAEDGDIAKHSPKVADGRDVLNDSESGLTLPPADNGIAQCPPGVNPGTENLPGPSNEISSMDPSNSGNNTSGKSLLVICTSDNRFQCSECNKVFEHKDRLVRHFLVHTRARAYSCSVCGKTFAWKSNFLRHVGVHTDERPFLCSVCGKGFRERRRLVEHERLHTGENPFACPECGKKVRTRHLLIVHKQSHVTGYPFPCSDCDKQFKRKTALVRHQKLNCRNSSKLCSECGKSFTRKYDLRVHMRYHSGKKVFPCSACGKAFICKADLFAHQRVHSSLKPFRCSECCKCFSYQASLDEHMKLHTGEMLFSCPECGKRFVKRRYLVRHQKNHTRKSKSVRKAELVGHAGEKPFQCSECGKTFTQKSHLIFHQSVHASEKPFPCFECGKSFIQESDLIVHQKVHVSEKHFPCSECGKCFVRRADFVVHQRVHTGERPFPCSACGKSFMRKVDLVSHQRVHANEKPFPCSECGKSFVRETDLAVHRRGHTGERPFPCSDCRKSFMRKVGLAIHRRVHTGKKPYPCPECGKSLSGQQRLKNHMQLHTGEKPFSCEQCGKRFIKQHYLAIHQRSHSGQQFECPVCGKCFSLKLHLIKHQETHA